MSLRGNHLPAVAGGSRERGAVVDGAAGGSAGRSSTASVRSGRARWSPLIGLLLVLLAGPAATGADFLPEIDLWPIVYYDVDRDTGAKALELLWPFGAWYSRNGESLACVRPFWSRRTFADENRQHSYYLIPWSGGNFRPDESERHFLFFFKQLNQKGPEGRDWLFACLPFLVLRGGPGGGGALIFPLFGHMTDWVGWDKLVTVVWPGFIYQRKGEVRKYSVLFPFFGWRTGPGSGFKIWPLFGRRGGDDELTFVLWPLFVQRKETLRSGAVRKTFISWPFWLQEDSPAGYVRSVLWPFFQYQYEKKNHRRLWKLPSPFVVIDRSDKRNSTRVLPLFIHVGSKSGTKLTLLWPFIWWRDETAAGTETRSFRFAPFLWLAGGKKDEAERKVAQLWPIFKWKRGLDGAVQLEVPSWVMRWRNDWYERHLAPFLRLFEYRREATGERDVRLLWRLGRWRSGQGGWFLELAPLFGLARGRPGAEPDSEAAEERFRFTLLKGLFDYRKTEEETRIKLLYLIPVWHRSSERRQETGG